MKLSALRFFVLPLLLAFLCGAAEGVQNQGVVLKDEFLRKDETRVTLDPGQFKDARVKEAYRVAKEIPWVLDSIDCFCMCKESPTFRHKSLLSCFVDNHAAV